MSLFWSVIETESNIDCYPKFILCQIMSMFICCDYCVFCFLTGPCMFPDQHWLVKSTIHVDFYSSYTNLLILNERFGLSKQKFHPTMVDLIWLFCLCRFFFNVTVWMYEVLLGFGQTCWNSQGSTQFRSSVCYLFFFILGPSAKIVCTIRNVELYLTLLRKFTDDTYPIYYILFIFVVCIFRLTHATWIIRISRVLEA